MFLIENGKDISDEEFEKLYKPHSDIVHQFMVNHTIPELIAFYLSSGYRLNAISNVSFDIHLSTCSNYFNAVLSSDDKKVITNETYRILKTRCGLIMTSLDSLDFKEIY